MLKKRKRAKERMFKERKREKERVFQVSSMADNSENVDKLLDGALDDLRNHNLSQTCSCLQSTVDRLEQLKKLVGSEALKPEWVYIRRGLAELTEAVKGLEKRVEQLCGKFDELAEAVKRLVTMVEQPFSKDQIVKIVVKVVQEITSSERGLAMFNDLEKGLDISCTCCDTQDAMAAQAGGDDFSNNPIMVGWLKQFENHVGPKVFAIAEQVLGLQDIGMRSKIETVLRQFLPKLILTLLCERMKYIGELYPKWLKENEASLSKEEYDRFFCQLELIKHLNEVYEHDPVNYNKSFEMLQKIQDCSEPPNAIVQELMLGLPFGLPNLWQLSPEMPESAGN